MENNTSNRAPLQCLRCQQPLQSLGELPLRSGGKTGGANFWLGEWAELSERIVRLDVYRCSRCGHLEFFDFDGSLPAK